MRFKDYGIMTKPILAMQVKPPYKDVTFEVLSKDNIGILEIELDANLDCNHITGYWFMSDPKTQKFTGCMWIVEGTQQLVIANIGDFFRIDNVSGYPMVISPEELQAKYVRVDK
jgi:hypothetical protein